MLNKRFSFFIIIILLASAAIISSGCQTGSTITPLPDLYVKVSFVNNTGVSSNRIHVAFRGLNTSRQTRYFDLTKEPIEFGSTSNMADVPDVTLDTLIARGNITVPYVESGRIYLAIDQRLGDEMSDYNQQNVTSGVIYDKIELDVQPTSNVVNLTQVDYFAMPIKITCGTEVRGFNDGITRKQILDEYTTAMSGSGGWENLLLKDTSGNRLRILNPAKIIPTDTANFSALLTYFNAIIDEYWANGKTMTVITDEVPHRQITGTANGSSVSFGSDGVYSKPTTLQMFGEAVEAGNSATVVKWLAGTINRGVIKNPTVTDQADSTKFYSASTAYSGGIYNRFAEFFHNSRYTIDGRAYALAFDDVFGRDSTLGVPNKETVTITLQAFQ